MALSDTGCARRLDRTSVRTAAQLLAKAESSDRDAETVAFVEGTYRLLGRLLAPGPGGRTLGGHAATGGHAASGGYAASGRSPVSAGSSVDIRI